MSADELAASELPPKFKHFIAERGLHPEQVFNMDETGLNIKFYLRKHLLQARKNQSLDLRQTKRE